MSNETETKQAPDKQTTNKNHQTRTTKQQAKQQSKKSDTPFKSERTSANTAPFTPPGPSTLNLSLIFMPVSFFPVLILIGDIAHVN